MSNHKEKFISVSKQNNMFGLSTTDDTFIDQMFTKNDYSTLDPLDNFKPLKSVCFDMTSRRAPTTASLK